MPSAKEITSKLHSWAKPTFIRRLLNKTIWNLKGPLANGDKFVILHDDYLNQFDEIIVVGDIHGCYTEFSELINKVHNDSPSRNPDKCLKILVGDLVNKGPKSLEVLKLCRDVYPESIIAVRGNHDELVLNEYNKAKGKNPIRVDNAWMATLPDRYISYLKLLPYAITIPSLRSIIVHAGLQPDSNNPVELTPEPLMLTMRNIVIEKTSDTAKPIYLCRKEIDKGAPWANFWPGPDHVYFGHDARRRLQKDHEFATGLDTGCVYGDTLTGVYIKGPKKGEFVQIKAKQAYQPVD